MIIVVNKKRNIERIRLEHPNAYILDITSSSPHHYGQILSPFYPHRNIPIPGDSHGMTATCVEAIWQGLKVFDNSDIDLLLFQNGTMKNIKRSTRKNGKLIGHRFGVFSDTILNYADARRYIYIPSYKYVLDNIPEVRMIIERIKEKANKSDIILLDYNLNPDNRDISKPLSHAELVKMYIEERYPSKDEDFIPLTKIEIDVQKNLSIKGNKAKLINDITELLQISEYTIKEICDILCLNVPAKTIKKIVESIPRITSRKEKRTIYYYISDPNKTTLFSPDNDSLTNN